MNKVLITGHRGSIGRRLNQRLLNLGHEVLGVDLKDGLDCADITNLDSFRGVDTVFHLAAHLQFPKKNTMDACDGILAFARREDAKVIYASSAAVYNPRGMYAVHKLYGEGVFMTSLKNACVLRLFNVYGGNGIGLIDKIEKKGHIRVNGNGEQRRDFVHVDDVVNAFVAVLDHNIEGILDVGTGTSYSVNEVLKLSDHNDYEYVVQDGGVDDSLAELNLKFPWYPSYRLHDYLTEKARLATTT